MQEPHSWYSEGNGEHVGGHESIFCFDFAVAKSRGFHHSPQPLKLGSLPPLFCSTVVALLLFQSDPPQPTSTHNAMSTKGGLQPAYTGQTWYATQPSSANSGAHRSVSLPWAPSQSIMAQIQPWNKVAQSLVGDLAPSPDPTFQNKRDDTIPNSDSNPLSYHERSHGVSFVPHTGLHLKWGAASGVARHAEFEVQFLSWQFAKGSLCVLLF